MGAYFLRRFLISIPVLVGITIIAFFVLASAPGDPVTALVDPEALGRMTPEQIQQIRERLGLDGPIYVRYARWLGLEPFFSIFTGSPDPVRGVLQGEFGYSIKSGRAIVTEVAPRIGPTLLLMGAAILIAIIVGIPFGVISAVRQYSKLDYTLTSFSFVMISTPTFVLGLLMIFLLAVQLRLLPTGGLFSLGKEFDVGSRIQHVIMPATILGLANAAQLMRYTRAGMLEVLSSDYMTTARAKGLRGRVVLIRHGLRNALIPIITILALILPELVAGAIVTEQVFNWPGMGLLAVRAAADRDPSLMMAIVLIVAIAVLVSNLIADFAYSVVDPRVRLDRAR
ncbi:MAG: ABC transporter permease [Gammaproteobacteria bacterium]|nr:ABC transporter permease [Gammaproteobacteria bacterium]